MSRTGRSPNEEPLASFPVSREKVPVATHARGTYLVSSLRALRLAGKQEAYFARLSPDDRAAIGAISAAEWYPMSLVIAHYQACESLGLPGNEPVEIGVTSIRHALGKTVDVAARLATGAGATPFTLLEQAPRHWHRIFQGSAVAAWKLGPKEARVEIVGFPIAAFRYVRVGGRGIIQGLTEPFCRKAYVNDIPDLCTAMSLGYRIAWV